MKQDSHHARAASKIRTQLYNIYDLLFTYYLNKMWFIYSIKLENKKTKGTNKNEAKMM